MRPDLPTNAALPSSPIIDCKQVLLCASIRGSARSVTRQGPCCLAESQLVGERLPVKRASPVDAYVGDRVRERRTVLGYNQQQLGEALGVSFQQIQKYERGANRISASRLYRLAKFLDAPVSFFFDGLSEGAPSDSYEHSEAPATRSEQVPYINRETLRLVGAYYKIRDPEARQQIPRLCTALSGQGAQDEDSGG